MATLVDSEFGEIDIDERTTTTRDSMTTVFNPALRATGSGGDPVIIIAVDGNRFLAVRADGRFNWLDHTTVRMDWRFDPEIDKWTDVAGTPLEEEPVA